ncbi:hypothetical protein FWH09_01580 [Candidatus Saccharibacteria bacterium]|nr:hypothetical protein [Candidatus Saccharibacteria bacterium]
MLKTSGSNVLAAEQPKTQVTRERTDSCCARQQPNYGRQSLNTTPIVTIERSEYLERRYSEDGKRMESLFRKAFSAQMAMPENPMVAVGVVLKEIPQAKVLLSDVWDEFCIMFGSGRESMPFEMTINGQPVCEDLVVMNSVIPTAIYHLTRSDIEMEQAKETLSSGGHFVAIGSSVGWGLIMALCNTRNPTSSLALIDVSGRAISIAEKQLEQLGLTDLARTYATGVFADNACVEFPADGISTIGFDGHYMSDESFIEFQRSKWKRLKPGGYMLFDVTHNDDEVMSNTLELLLHLKSISYGAGLGFRYRSVDEVFSLLQKADLGETKVTVFKCGNYGTVFKVEK